MPFQSLCIQLPQHQVEAFGDLLMERGALSVSVEDADEGTAEERAIFGEPGASAEIWQRCEVNALFDANADVRRIALDVASALEIEKLSFAVESVDDADWVRLTQSQFQPIVISPRIAIVPTWHEAPNQAPDAINIVLDPGAAFGTGSHPTTRLCLQWLEANLRAGETVLDYGTGSGILAIAAMKLGARSAIGVDIDPAAVEAAGYNAAQNEVALTCATTEQAVDAVADITLANILANPLKVLAPLLAAHTRAGGRVVLAGLLDEQAEELIAIYAPYFSLTVWQRAEGWSCLAGTRHL
jgi:ribosomal protein L11 methyltransferase